MADRRTPADQVHSKRPSIYISPFVLPRPAVYLSRNKSSNIEKAISAVPGLTAPSPPDTPRLRRKSTKPGKACVEMSHEDVKKEFGHDQEEEEEEEKVPEKEDNKSRPSHITRSQHPLPNEHSNPEPTTKRKAAETKPASEPELQAPANKRARTETDAERIRRLEQECGQLAQKHTLDHHQIDE
ncbi:uncharacterized protein K452DRAFT_308019 [Aplosporella prunicola CBS 121167]|uniref:Uncharacterized protein n=1 Tax=Aplosporella prunicola CBS 121167 TaxID=1176127 RepID=A0A6A6BFZ7_9PEZI|nr:uncharacterized protein K452DRAFT_308019 [Aplosporella prunicola CBS 121167]KAF2142323.1 hypothetical protein K452DRAFT_308019 [Aplosporella prunicola CBS 121167]